MSMSAILSRLLSGLCLLLCTWGMAWAEEGVVISTNGSRASILLVDTPIPAIGSTVTASQNGLLGNSVSSARGAVTAVKGSTVELATDSPLQTGPITLTILSVPGTEELSTETGSTPDEGSAIGMRVGNLEPNFALPGQNDGNAGAPPETQTDTPDEAAVLALVREWISVAEPPQNGEPDYHLRYTNWAQLVGTTPTGIITANAKPDDVGGLPYDVYLWTRHTDLPSLNHCTLRQYVTTRLEGGSLTGCGGNAPTATTASASEARENEEATTAQPVPGTTSITGRLFPKSDRDEFIFSAPHHGEWSFTVANAPAGIDINLGVYPAPNGGWLPDMSPDGDGRLVVDLPDPGAYILRVTASSSNVESQSAYVINAVFTRSPDLFEPNDAVPEANPIEGTRQITGTILPRGEQDEFIFEADHHGEWTVRITDQPNELGLSLGVYPHPNGGWLPDMSPDDDGQIVVDLPKPGKYVLRAKSVSSSSRSVSPYTLDLSYIASPDQFEPNNNVPQAQIIEGTRQITGTILPRGEQDEFIFEADHHGEWTVRITDQPKDLGLSLGVYPHPNGGWLPDMSPDDDGQIVVDLPKPGKYVLRAKSVSSSSRSVSPYQLMANFLRSPDLSEPNGTVNTAKSIAGSGQILGTILPRGEQDEYVFSASEKQIVTVTTHKTPGFDLSVGIYKAPNGGWLSDKNPAPDILTVETPSSGDYILRIRATSGNDRSVAPYQLSISR
jgi:uncharacterized protein YdeI (BOF family)